ncbi:putative epoxide hydrolase [Periconia macrospinosa]|uniref:Putative epoxide hydrolase n=1 Tax=Periconia macrospinosa TaxID=97972 RepID=A0A2V1D5E7_9PLEO|nr:putative epoxide hydrolase [Periconia macrospinosa]
MFTLHRVFFLLSPRPYTLNINPEFVEQTRLKAANFRTSIEIAAPAWFDGPPESNISALASYWAKEYNWPSEQERLNEQFDHYMTTVPPPAGSYNESLDIHFIHQKSKKDDAIPLLMLHGWPSTSLEWEKVIPLLTNPGEENTTSFHVVAPDLPGFGFSPAPKAPGLNTTLHGIAFANLMGQLGYERFALYSTDIGAVIAMTMVAAYEYRITHHFCDMLAVIPDQNDLARYAANQSTPEEAAYIPSVQSFFGKHSAYSTVHASYPLSIAYALNDSPVGFLAWIYQLLYTASDIAYTKDEIIRQTFLLYAPGVYGNIRAYKEGFDITLFAPAKKSSVPTSALQFGLPSNPGFAYQDVVNYNYVPRSWLDRFHNITHFARYDKGGHFPAESVPKLVVKEIRAAYTL